MNLNAALLVVGRPCTFAEERMLNERRRVAERS